VDEAVRFIQPDDQWTFSRLTNGPGLGAIRKMGLDGTASGGLGWVAAGLFSALIHSARGGLR